MPNGLGPSYSNLGYPPVHPPASPLADRDAPGAARRRVTPALKKGETFAFPAGPGGSARRQRLERPRFSQVFLRAAATVSLLAVHDLPARAQQISVSSSPPAEVVRGQQLMKLGDISGARRLFEYAAERGSGAAATSLGRTFDPAELRRLHVMGGISADPEQARLWYERGRDLGDPEAAPLLSALNDRQ